MRASLPLVVSPLRKVMQRDGVEVMLVSVEVWSDEVVVRARGLPSQLTSALDREFHNDLDRWHEQRADPQALPQQPAERIFDINVSVVDDVDTAYELKSSSRGGSGTMFRAEWSFLPGPPVTARWLSVRTAGLDSRIELDPSP